MSVKYLWDLQNLWKRSLFHILNGCAQICSPTALFHGPWNSRVVSLVWQLPASQSSLGDWQWFFSCVQSVCPSVCPSVRHTFFTMFPSSYHHEILRSYYHGQKWCPCKRSRSQKSTPNLAVPRLFEFTYGNEIMYTAWSSIEEVPYCFQGHLSNFKVTRGKNRRFWPEFGVSGLFNSSLKWPMAMKWYTKLEVA